MALPDELPRPRVQPGRRSREHLLAVLAGAALAAASAFWIIEASVGYEPLMPGLTGKLWLLGSVLVVAWLIGSAERRLLEHLQRIERTQYRDGYAAGYVDAASRRDSRPEAPTLRSIE